MLNRTDIEATLCALLLRFRDSEDQGSTQIARFAQAGAEALLTQTQLAPWLDSAASSAILGITPEALDHEVRNGTLSAVRAPDGQPHFHRRDVSLYRLGQLLGATEQLVQPLAEQNPWSADPDDNGLDPWLELTPG